MTSLSRTFGQIHKLGTRFVKPQSPCYTEDNETVVLFPFSYSNGILDISYAGNNFKTINVDISGVAPESETDIAIRITSGPFLVHSLGDNFKNYIRAWRESTIDANSPIEIYIFPQVLRIQECDINNVSANSGESYIISTNPPSNDYYIAGTSTTQYDTKYIFKTPLTFTIKESSITKYITFTSYFDQE